MKPDDLTGQPFSPDPIAVIEVLSRSNTKADRQWRLDAYAATTSIEPYLMVEQRRVQVVLYDRSRGWTATDRRDIAGAIEYPRSAPRFHSRRSISGPASTQARASPLALKTRLWADKARRHATLGDQAAKADQVREIIARYPVRHPQVFGSVARGEGTEGAISSAGGAAPRNHVFDLSQAATRTGGVARGRG